MATDTRTIDRLLQQAHLLALITIGYNIAEGAISVWLGKARGAVCSCPTVDG